MTSNSMIGARLRRARLSLGLVQSDLSDQLTRAGLPTTQVLISQLENGRATLGDEHLERYAAALHVSTAFLKAPGDEPLVTRPMLRAYADAPQRSVEQQVADATMFSDVAQRLGLRPLPDVMPTWDGDLNDPADVEAYAMDVRTAAGLDEHAVVGNSIRAAERLGCIVLPMHEELGRHLGLSLRIDNTPILCVSRSTDQVPGDRQRFTVAHELGHVGMHAHLPPPGSPQEATRIEKQAHLFASAFLAPREAMLEELYQAGGRVTLSNLAQIKGRWGIAIKALVMRYQSLGVIDADHARSLYKQISARKWNKTEPVPVGSESAVWFSTASSKRHGPDRAALARLIGVDMVHLDRWTQWDKPAPRADVLAFPTATGTPLAEARHSASVHALSSRRSRA